MLIHYILFVPFTMSLIPSNQLVQDKLVALREERAKAREAFREAVALARIDWEAELLLDLEEFRDSGGFVQFQGELERQIEIQAQSDDFRRGGLSQKVSISAQQNSAILKIYSPDVLDLKQALTYARHNTSIYSEGEPTMETERAVFRFKFFRNIFNGIKSAIDTKRAEQVLKDKALLEERQRLAQEERAARRRIMGY